LPPFRPGLLVERSRCLKGRARQPAMLQSVPCRLCPIRNVTMAYPSL
jgi:hypothetical protein